MKLLLLFSFIFSTLVSAQSGKDDMMAELDEGIALLKAVCLQGQGKILERNTKTTANGKTFQHGNKSIFCTYGLRTNAKEAYDKYMANKEAKENGEEIAGCEWIQGKKVLGTVTHNVLQCKSQVCAGKAMCTDQYGIPTTKHVACHTVDNECPSADACAQDEQIIGLIGNKEAKFKIDKVVPGAKQE
jgi:hypothetical protein